MKSGEALSMDGMGQKLWLSRSEPLKVAQSQGKSVWLLSQSHFISLAVGAEPSRDNTSYNESLVATTFMIKPRQLPGSRCV